MALLCHAARSDDPLHAALQAGVSGNNQTLLQALCRVSQPLLPAQFLILDAAGHVYFPYTQPHLPTAPVYAMHLTNDPGWSLGWLMPVASTGSPGPIAAEDPHHNAPLQTPATADGEVATPAIIAFDENVPPAEDAFMDYNVAEAAADSACNVLQCLLFTAQLPPAIFCVVCASACLCPLPGMCCASIFSCTECVVVLFFFFCVPADGHSGFLAFAGTTRLPLGPFSELSAICCTSLQTCIAPGSLPLHVCVPGCSPAASGSTSLRTLSSSSTLPYTAGLALPLCATAGVVALPCGMLVPGAHFLFATGLRPCSSRKIQMAFGRSASRIASRFRHHGLSAIQFATF